MISDESWTPQRLLEWIEEWWAKQAGAEAYGVYNNVKAAAHDWANDNAAPTICSSYSISQIQKWLAGWRKKHFGEGPSYHPLLGDLEELGELAHAHLKEEQDHPQPNMGRLRQRCCW